MTKRLFPPIDCEWAKDKGAFKPDYCALGDALREQIEYRKKQSEELEKLKAAVLGLRYFCAADHGGYTVKTRRAIEDEIDKVVREFVHTSVNGEGEK